MRALASAFIVLLTPASLLAEGRSEMDILRSRCTEQERQIRTLETEIESLHSQLALERRRSRGVLTESTTATVATSATATSEASAPEATYIVKAGDTLSSIARRYRTSADELMKRNGIKDATRMRVGQVLKLPVEAKLPKTAPAPKVEPKKIASGSKLSPKATAEASGAYQVKRGDTLYGIARKHKMSVSDLRALNPKVENKIVAGQSLIISGKPSAPSLGSAKTVTIATRSTTPAAAPKATPKAAPKAAPAKKAAPEKAKPEPLVAAKPEKKEESKPAAPKTISSIIVMDEISFGDFAKKHGTTAEQLNALNGWDFKSNLVLARGSEIYVPGQ